MRFLALSALVGAALAQKRGFNYGSTNPDGSPRVQQDFENEFNRAKNLQGQSGFTSARLYTMIQGNTADTVSSAIPAAINTKTTLLLGLWGSGGQAGFTNELTALTNAINQYGTAFTSLIDGISVGSEDLYRITPTGIENKSGVGAGPADLVNYINQLRNTIKGTAASGAKVGHVDTWTAWVNGSNSAVINAVDWLGMDGYPYFQTTQANGIENAPALFFDSYNATVGVAGGKPVWITETGYPVQGPTAGQAVASVPNAETYWQDVACRVLGNINTWWFTLHDPQASGAVSFGLVGPNLDSAPLYNLACSGGNSQSSSSSSAQQSSTAVAPTQQSSTAVAPTQPTTSAAVSSLTIVTTPNVESSPAPTTTGSAPGSQSQPAGNGGDTVTVYQTTLVTITSCGPSTTCITSVTATSAPVVTSTTPASPGKSCPTDLSGPYEYPHLIVPVDSANPDKAYGTSYNVTITPTISSIINFDIPASDAGKTCSLVFLFPNQKDLQTSAYTFNGKGGITVETLAGPADASTTYSNAPKPGDLSQTFASIAAGNSYTVFSHECSAGERIAYEFKSVGGLELNYFQDYNPSPLGAYITVC